MRVISPPPTVTAPYQPHSPCHYDAFRQSAASASAEPADTPLILRQPLRQRHYAATAAIITLADAYT